MSNTVRIQVQHEWQPNSHPYETDVEAALDALKSAGLIERGWDKSNDPGIIRHETGPEIITLIGAVISLSVAILELVRASQKHHPETTINVTVSNPKDLKKVLAVLGTQD